MTSPPNTIVSWSISPDEAEAASRAASSRSTGKSVLDSRPRGRAVEKITREQMLSEFGAPGVENSKVVDLIGVDPASDKVVLTMIERRAWGASDLQFQQIEEKINRYMGYALDGFLPSTTRRTRARRSRSGSSASRNRTARRSCSSRRRRAPPATTGWSSSCR